VARSLERRYETGFYNYDEYFHLKIPRPPQPRALEAVELRVTKMIRKREEGRDSKKATAREKERTEEADRKKMKFQRRKRGKVKSDTGRDPKGGSQTERMREIKKKR